MGGSESSSDTTNLTTNIGTSSTAVGGTSFSITDTGTTFQSVIGGGDVTVGLTGSDAVAFGGQFAALQLETERLQTQQINSILQAAGAAFSGFTGGAGSPGGFAPTVVAGPALPAPGPQVQEAPSGGGQRFGNLILAVAAAGGLILVLNLK